MSHFARSNAVQLAQSGAFEGVRATYSGRLRIGDLVPLVPAARPAESRQGPDAKTSRPHSQHIAVDARVFGEGNALGTRWRQGFASVWSGHDVALGGR